MPSLIASPLRVWNCEVSSSNRPPQYGQRRNSSVSIRMLRLADLFEERDAGRVDRCSPELLDAEPPSRLLVVDPGHRVVGADLRAMAAERGQLARHPVADVDHKRRRRRAQTEGV